MNLYAFGLLVVACVANAQPFGMQWSGIGGFGSGLGILGALGGMGMGGLGGMGMGMGMGGISPFHIMELRERPQACVYADGYNSRYSSREALASFDGINDHIRHGELFYPLCVYQHTEAPVLDAHGTPIWFEIPPGAQESRQARQYAGNAGQRSGRGGNSRQGQMNSGVNSRQAGSYGQDMSAYYSQ